MGENVKSLYLWIGKLGDGEFGTEKKIKNEVKEKRKNLHIPYRQQTDEE